MIAIPARTIIESEAAVPLAHPALRALLGRWHAHRGQRLLPSEADLSFFNLKPWLGRVRRIAVGNGGRSFDLMPCALAQIEPSAEKLSTAYRQAVFGASPVRTVPGPGAEGLVLPFADSGRGVSLLLVAAYDSVSR